LWLSTASLQRNADRSHKRKIEAKQKTKKRKSVPINHLDQSALLRNTSHEGIHVDNRRATDVLNGDLNNNENVKWLYDRFIEDLESFAKNQIGEDFRRYFDEQDIAETAFRQALDRMHSDSNYVRNSLVFRTLLYQVARRAIAKKIRFYTKESGDVSLETIPASAFGDVIVDSKPLTPDEQVSVREEMRNGLGMLIQEKDPMRMLINLFGVAMELKASDIAEILKDLPEKQRTIPSLPTIRLQIERTQERLRQSQEEAKQKE
jgi:hypothetical protein